MALLGGGIFLTLFIILFVVLLPLLALISVLSSEFYGNDKIMWVLIIIFLPFLGSILNLPITVTAQYVCLSYFQVQQAIIRASQGVTNTVSSLTLYTQW